MTETTPTLARLMRRQRKALVEQIAKTIDKTAALQAQLSTLRKAMDEAGISEHEEEENQIPMNFDGDDEPNRGTF